MPPSEDTLLASHARLGARFEERRGRVLVASYGDAAGEYAEARERAGLLHLAERDVLVAKGAVRQKFLNGMVTNDVLGLAPGRGCRAALLSANGHVQALLRVLAQKDAVSLELDADRLEPVRSLLEHHRVAAPVSFLPRPTVVLALVGPAASEALAQAGFALSPSDPESHVEWLMAGEPVAVARAGDLPGSGFVLHAPPAVAPAVFEALLAAGARPLGREAADALRIEALRPWFGTDVTEANLLHEAGLVRECHSPTKGCYIGQEIVARLEARGANVNKALRGLRLTQPAAAGDAITLDGHELGRLTSTALSPRLGPIALGYVQRGHNADATTVTVGSAAATVVTAFTEPA